MAVAVKGVFAQIVAVTGVNTILGKTLTVTI